MNNLRILLVGNNAGESDRIAECLEKGSHAVLPAQGLDEAAQALQVQQFDAVMLPYRLVSEDLQPFRDALNRFESKRNSAGRIPLLCYVSSASERPTMDELSRYHVDGCLPEPFDAVSFCRMVAGLASQLASSSASRSEDPELLLPVFNADEFREQVGFDRELIVEIIELFLVESQKQVSDMRSALDAGDLATLSRVAHSIKGSLGSLYATRATARAQKLEQVAKAGDRDNSGRAFSMLESDLQRLQPELIALRDAESGS